ncbi:hypothetical protein [Erythrobacter sp.]|jgi:hypothetical protein|uniref:hypothetical protein n=1 Tax=Erythrobacter sp. TaxID=1042 RepID=UPI002EB72D68|nr:hypothetical protein [Erythrobacter sp.]
MTLQNGLLTPDAAYLWSDSALWDWHGQQLVGHENKIFVGWDWPWALVHSGTNDVAAVIEFEICTAGPSSLRELVGCIRTAMRPHLDHPWPNAQRALLAAYEGGPHLLLVTTEEMAGYPPLAPLPIRPQMVSGDSEAIRAEVAKGVTPDSMTRVIRQQHADCLMEGNFPLAGTVTRARVSAEGVEMVEVDELPVGV